MELRGGQLSRILNIIQILYARKRGVTAKELSSLSGSSLRTAYRDLSVIENSGFPIIVETINNTSYYKLIDNFKKEFPLTFSFDELMALYYSRDILNIFNGTGLQDSIESIIKKVKNVIPQHAVKFIKNVDKSFSLSTGQKIDYSHKNDFIKKINTAIAKKRIIEIVYESTKRKELLKRKVEPYTLYFSQGLIYLVGHCQLRNSIRIFAITRILDVALTDCEYSIPKDFNVQKYFEDSFNVYRGKKDSVELFFTADVAPFIRERIFHRSQIIKNTSSGIIMKLDIGITPDFKTFLMGWGEHVKIIKPLKLKNELKKRHMMAANHI